MSCKHVQENDKQYVMSTAKCHANYWVKNVPTNAKQYVMNMHARILHGGVVMPDITWKKPLESPLERPASYLS